MVPALAVASPTISMSSAFLLGHACGRKSDRFLPSISLTGTPNMRAAVSRAALITHPAVVPNIHQSKVKFLKKL